MTGPEPAALEDRRFHPSLETHAANADRTGLVAILGFNHNVEHRFGQPTERLQPRLYDLRGLIGTAVAVDRSVLTVESMSPRVRVFRNNVQLVRLPAVPHVEAAGEERVRWRDLLAPHVGGGLLPHLR